MGLTGGMEKCVSVHYILTAHIAGVLRDHKNRPSANFFFL